MSELREECEKCLNNQKCIGGAEYGSLYCMINRKFKMTREEDSVYAHKFAIMQKQIDEKDKRIKELEEHQKINGELKEKIKELDKKIEKEKKLTRLAQTLTDESIKEALIEFEKDYISKQKVKDLIINETINISGFECIAVEDLKKLLKEKINE